MQPVAYTYRKNVLTSQKSEKNARRGYRFLYQGQEVDNEIYGDYGAYSFEYRVHDPRLGRWMAVDPLEEKYPFLSPYAYVNNNPIINREIDGKDFIVSITPNANGKGGVVKISTTIYTTSASYERASDASNLIMTQANGKFTYNWIDSDGIQQVYDIVFDIRVEKIAPEVEALPYISNAQAGMPITDEYSNSFDIVDDITPSFEAIKLGLTEKNKNDEHTGAVTANNKHVFVRKSFEGLTSPSLSNPGLMIKKDLHGDAHEILTHLFSGGMKRGLDAHGHTSSPGDITHPNLNQTGNNINKATVINSMQIIGAAMGNYEYKMGNGTDAPKAKTVGDVPGKFNSGTVEYK